jgi:hypothetical protein
MEIINWKIAAHPINWVILFLMAFIAMIAITLVLDSFSGPVAA